MSDANFKELMEKLQESALKLAEVMDTLEKGYKEALEKIEDDSIKTAFEYLMGITQVRYKFLLDLMNLRFQLTQTVLSPALAKYFEEFAKNQEWGMKPI